MPVTNNVLFSSFALLRNHVISFFSVPRSGAFDLSLCLLRDFFIYYGPLHGFSPLSNHERGFYWSRRFCQFSRETIQIGIFTYTVHIPVVALHRPVKSSKGRLRVPARRKRMPSRAVACDQGLDFRFRSYLHPRWKLDSRCPLALSTARLTRASAFLLDVVWEQDFIVVFFQIFSREKYLSIRLFVLSSNARNKIIFQFANRSNIFWLVFVADVI